ncbi:MAG: PAS domain S-box protein [Candidatus Melainabacteria bacterium]|nr:PAS domain S-box protein [Candidatus Melainabacteria bacterium]
MKSSTRSQTISDIINRLTSDIFEIVERYRTYEALENVPFDDDLGNMMFKRVSKDYQELREITKDQPDIFSAVNNSEKTTYESLQRFQAIKNALRAALPNTKKERILIARKFRARPDDAVFQRLIEIGKEQKRLSERAPEEQADFRRKAQVVMIFLGVFDLLLGIALSLFLTRGITTRLQRVSDNTFKLAGGLPLHPVLQGSDEIATLDQVFHKMAFELKEASRKERAVVANARDFICTIDSNGRFVAANPASTTLLGVKTEDLLGQHVVDLIVGVDKDKVLNHLEGLKHETAPAPFEIEMHTASGSTIETIWSAHWSDEEDSVFCVVHDITDRRRAEKLKQEVMAMITHDLRSPLSTINNVLDFFEVLVTGGSDERGQRYLNMARRNTDRMLTLINDLLDIEKIKSGNMTIEVESFALETCLSSCEGLSAGLAEEIGVKLVFEPTDSVVAADQKLIDRVLSNLVSNAIKFSPKGKTVRVSSLLDGDFVLIKVEDQGPGIPIDQLESVFERFRQVRAPGAKTKGGSGLGLAICKAIVELHGGKIWVESTSSGSSFFFTVPLASTGTAVES